VPDVGHLERHVDISLALANTWDVECSSRMDPHFRRWSVEDPSHVLADLTGEERPLGIGFALPLVSDPLGPKGVPLSDSQPVLVVLGVKMGNF